MRAPDFWYPPPGTGIPLAARLLMPAALLYERIGTMRVEAVTPYRAAVPVICVGNLTAGGTGKTPIALAIAARLAARGRSPVFLTRGYGGRERGPLAVDHERHSARDVGDEPLLLARAHPTVVARDRIEGANAACAMGAGTIVMDDGFQNPALAKDLSFIAIDAGLGFGNGLVIPAGPLRETVPHGLARADAVVLMDEGAPPAALSRFPRPVLRAGLEPDKRTYETLRGRKVVAFAGIGRPSKFFGELIAMGAEIVEAVPFPDHHPYSAAEIAALKERAGPTRLLITTEKDFVRLSPAQREGIGTLSVHAVFEDEAALDALLSRIGGG